MKNIKKYLIIAGVALSMHAPKIQAYTNEETVLIGAAIGAVTGTISAKSEMPLVWNWIIESIARNALVSSIAHPGWNNRYISCHTLSNSARASSWLAWLLFYKTNNNQPWFQINWTTNNTTICKQEEPIKL